MLILAFSLMFLAQSTKTLEVRRGQLAGLPGPPPPSPAVALRLRRFRVLSGSLGNGHSISNRFFQCFSCIMDRVCQKTPTVQIGWEKIESQYRIPNFGQTIRNRLCNLGQTIRNRPCNLGQTIQTGPCNSGRPIRTRPCNLGGPYGILVLQNARQES